MRMEPPGSGHRLPGVGRHSGMQAKRPGARNAPGTGPTSKGRESLFIRSEVPSRVREKSHSSRLPPARRSLEEPAKPGQQAPEPVANHCYQADREQKEEESVHDFGPPEE